MYKHFPSARLDKTEILFLKIYKKKFDIVDKKKYWHKTQNYKKNVGPVGNTLKTRCLNRDRLGIE